MYRNSPKLQVLTGVVACTLLTLPLRAEDATVAPSETDPAVIMQAVFDRTTGDKVVGHMQMTITDRSGRERVRAVVSESLDFAEGTKTLMLFASPADVRNTGLLSVDWDDSTKDDDQWLYLPSLHKSTRISSGDKSGAFMGSDFSYADMTKRTLDQYNFKLLKASVTIGGEECWLIENRPKTEKTRDETGYVKSQQWISKSKMMPVQSKSWVREGKKLKYIKFGDFKQIDGIWTAQKLSARTMRGKAVESTTVLQYTSLAFNNASVVDTNFTQRRLEKGL